MPEYRSYGARDDRVTKDGDVGFIGFNNRLRPDQLQAGMLADAQNIRLDRNGEAQVRKGIELIEAPFAVGGDVLRLPTTAEIGTDVSRLPTTIESASLTSNVVSLVLNEPAVEPGYDFQVGDEVTVEGIYQNLSIVATESNGGSNSIASGTYSYWRMNEGKPQYRKLVNGVAVADIFWGFRYVDGSPSPNPAWNIQYYSNGVYAESSEDVATPDLVQNWSILNPAEGYNYSTNHDITSLSVTLDSHPNGTFTLTGVTDSGSTSTLTYALTGSDETFTTAIVLPETLPFTLNGITTQAVVGFNMVLDRGNVTEVYASTRYSDPADNASQYILIASNLKVVAKNLLTGATTDIVYPAGETVPVESDMIQAFNKVFIFRNGQTALEWDGDFSGTPAFTKVASGAYSQPKQLSPSSLDITDGKATATFNTIAAMNGTDVGDIIEIEAIGNSPLVVGEKYVVAERDNSVPSLSFFVQHENTNNANSVIFQQPVSVGLGFTHMPAPPFAIYHQRRLVMPYRFTVDTAADSFTSRGILDEVIASDILDSDTYDQIFAQYRFNAGTADFVVGLHSFAEDRLLIFNRNSIHLVENTTNLQGASTRLLTDEVGCVARKSIIQVGNQVIFLSDNGIYGTQFLDEYNLRGTETPLSESINTTIQRINRNAWTQSVAAYFDNRYFIAVPLDNATRNNAILVFNFLNKQWESIDTTSNTDWDIENLVVAGDGAQRGVYAINRFGGIHKLDQRVDGEDRIVTFIGGESEGIDIPASITTRQYTLGTLDRKRWKEFDIHAQSSEDNASDFDISIETENPDTVESLGSLSTFNGSALDIGEDVSIRGRIGNRRGYGLQFTINNTSGRPRIRAIETEGSTAMRSTQKAI